MVNVGKQEAGGMINLGIAGLGGWGKNLVKSVQNKSDTVRFAVAATRTPAKVADFCSEHDVRLADDLSMVLEDAAIDGVVVAGPAQLHAEVAKAALEAGKHVMVIKPLALFRKDAEGLRRTAEDRNLVLAMGHDRCFLPAVDELRQCVKAGDLGRIIHAEGDFCVDRYFGLPEGDWKSNDANSQPGSLADHMLYTMIELVGPVDSVFVQAAHMAAPVDISDTATVSMRFASGASGSLTAIGVTPVFQRLHLFGTDGWAEIRNNRRYEFQPLKGEGRVVEFPAFDALKCQLESFAAAVKGEASFPVSPENAVAGVAALEAMGRSALSGRMETV
jgi:predicted dehydrogenase